MPYAVLYINANTVFEFHNKVVFKDGDFFVLLKLQ